jgi:hypothetical protein
MADYRAWEGKAKRKSDQGLDDSEEREKMASLLKAMKVLNPDA